MQDRQKARLEEILLREIGNLRQMTEDHIPQDVAVHEMEWSYLRQVLQVCRKLLEFIIEVKIAQKREKRPIALGGEKLIKKGNQYRKYLSLFGLLSFSRPSYWSKARGTLYVLDEDLKLPKDRLSYNIQELLGGNASELDYRESVRVINQILELDLHEKTSERNILQLGPQVAAYYADKAVEEERSPICFSASFDGKGVPKIKDKSLAKPTSKRLGKGEKNGVMQMATVGVLSCFEPKVRSVDSIIRGMMDSPLSKVEKDEQGQKEQADNRWHEKIHRRAFLANQAGCIDYGIRYIKERMLHKDSRFVVPIDAGIGLEEQVNAAVKKYELEDQFAGIILDIIHVSEYVWTAATAIFGESSKVRSPWVRDVLTDLLNSKTQQVITDLENIIDKGNLSKSKIKKVQKTITYFTNHQHKMDYKTYLERGYPVSSALVESACGHLVKERMEGSGMRWSSAGAQSMMDIRAVKQNGDLVDFMKFIHKKDRQHKSAD